MVPSIASRSETCHRGRKRASSPSLAAPFARGSHPVLTVELTGESATGEPLAAPAGTATVQATPDLASTVVDPEELELIAAAHAYRGERRAQRALRRGHLAEATATCATRGKLSSAWDGPSWPRSGGAGGRRRGGSPARPGPREAHQGGDAAADGLTAGRSAVQKGLRQELRKRERTRKRETRLEKQSGAAPSNKLSIRVFRAFASFRAFAVPDRTPFPHRDPAREDWAPTSSNDT